MRQTTFHSLMVSTLMAALMFSQPAISAFSVTAQTAPKPLTRDETYFSIARRIAEQSESPVSDVVGSLDEVMEVTQITPDKDGKTTVVVKEKAEASASHPQKSIRLVFAPAGEKWRWESFENQSKLYPVEKLFPYAKDELTKRRLTVEQTFASLLMVMISEGETAFKAMEAAKAVIRNEPAPLAQINAARASLTKAIKDKEIPGILAAHQQLSQAVEPVATFADQYGDLKANDAYLRLMDEFHRARNTLPQARRNYIEAVNAHNEVLRRLPFGLVAYGVGFTRIEAQMEPE
jgi:hypothetical protein